jgi:hypothetical protein
VNSPKLIKMKNYFIYIGLLFLFASCGGEMKEDIMQNDLYKKFAKQIDRYDSWKRTEYNTILHNFNTMKKDATIDSRIYDVLIETLNGKHVELLTDTLNNFCRMQSNLNVVAISHLQKEVQEFAKKSNTETDEAEGLITDYLRLVELLQPSKGSVLNYVAYQRFYPKTTDDYDLELSKFKSKSPFSNNPNLRNTIDATRTSLSTHKTAGEGYETIMADLSSMDACSKAFPGTYYYQRSCKLDFIEAYLSENKAYFVKKDVKDWREKIEDLKLLKSQEERRAKLLADLDAVELKLSGK